MPSDVSNDNFDLVMPHGPDAHGQAAILLVESLVHGLIAREVITVADAVEMIDIAAGAHIEMASGGGDSPATLRRSLDLLDAISSSLRHDVP